MKKLIILILSVIFSLALYSQSGDSLIIVLQEQNNKIKSINYKTNLIKSNQALLKSKVDNRFDSLLIAVNSLRIDIFQMHKKVNSINDSIRDLAIETTVLKTKNRSIIDLNRLIIIISVIIFSGLVIFVIMLIRRINQMGDSILYLMEMQTDENKAFFADLNKKIGKNSKTVSKKIIKTIEEETKKNKKKKK